MVKAYDLCFHRLISRSLSWIWVSSKRFLDDGFKGKDRYGEFSDCVNLVSLMQDKVTFSINILKIH